MALSGVRSATTLPFSLLNASILKDQRGSQTRSVKHPAVGAERGLPGERLKARQRRRSISSFERNSLQLSVPYETERLPGRKVISCATSATQSPASIEGNQFHADENDSRSQGQSANTRTVHIELTPLTKENFAPYGQVCGPSPDNVEFGESPEDAYLELEGGTPRLYILRLKGKKLQFDQITHHARVTQCLGSADGRPWYMGVAPPSLLSDVPGEDGRLPWTPPAVDDVRVFKIEGSAFIKLNKGTWHAGPLFETPQMDFYNLEHTDTNVTDHNTHVFSQNDGVEFVIDTD